MLDYAKTVNGGFNKQAQEFTKKTIKEIQKMMEAYPQNICADWKQEYWGDFYKDMDQLILCHNKFPFLGVEFNCFSKVFGKPKEKIWLNACLGGDHMTPRDVQLMIINNLLGEVSRYKKKGKDTTELIDATDQLARFIGEKKYYKENISAILSAQSL